MRKVSGCLYSKKRFTCRPRHRTISQRQPSYPQALCPIPKCARRGALPAGPAEPQTRRPGLRRDSLSLLSLSVYMAFLLPTTAGRREWRRDGGKEGQGRKAMGGVEAGCRGGQQMDRHRMCKHEDG